MRIAIPKECRPHERRVAVSPDVVRKYVSLGFDVVVESGAGDAANMVNAMFSESGAHIASDAAMALSDADIVLKIQRPLTEPEGRGEISLLKKGAVLVANLAVLSHPHEISAYAEAGLTAFAMELMPRISRAQSMDILSSQSNLAGYKAVIDAAALFTRAMPMMMTAAGTIPPTRVLVLGAGVAGLQAIATARRLGAIVYAFDVRYAVKEQVESLGGKFVVVDERAMKSAETASGYAREMDEDYKKKQESVLHEQLKRTDIVITTALIPGKTAPILVTEEMVQDMKPGSVIMDLAVEAGGNCVLSEYGRVVQKYDVNIVGPANLASTVAYDSSVLFAKNIYNFLHPMMNRTSSSLQIPWDDELVKGTCVCHAGKIVHPMLLSGEEKK